MTSSAKTLRAIERAAMRWWKTPESGPLSTPEQQARSDAAVIELVKACAAHAAALKRTGRR